MEYEIINIVKTALEVKKNNWTDATDYSKNIIENKYGKYFNVFFYYGKFSYSYTYFDKKFIKLVDESNNLEILIFYTK